MRAGAAIVLALSLAAAGVCAEDGGQSRESGTRIERPAISARNAGEAVERAAERLNGMARPDAPDLFPVTPDPLRPGVPSRIRVRGLPRPVFAIGADEASLAWLAANAERLRADSAQGLLVAARSEAVLRRARAFAARHGLTLDPMPGAALATAFGAATYPFVAEPSE